MDVRLSTYQVLNKAYAIWFAQEVFRKIEERGQARLPNLETMELLDGIHLESLVG
jgi:hypothetical protein